MIVEKQVAVIAKNKKELEKWQQIHSWIFDNNYNHISKWNDNIIEPDLESLKKEEIEEYIRHYIRKRYYNCNK